MAKIKAVQALIKRRTVHILSLIFPCFIYHKTIEVTYRYHFSHWKTVLYSYSSNVMS